MTPCNSFQRNSASHSAVLALVILAGAAWLLPTAARPASAATWAESGDAGQTLGTAQSTAGVGVLSSIQGTIQTDTDVDLYCIHITNPGAFSATILCTVIADNDLWLFDASGIGREQDDGCQASAVFLSNAFVGAAGTYYLGVSADNADAYSSGGNIWLSPFVSTPRAPDGPGGAQALIGWAGTSHANVVSYSIQLSGCGFCDAAVDASSDTWGAIKQLYR
jgi:hypothetical protein